MRTAALAEHSRVESDLLVGIQELLCHRPLQTERTVCMMRVHAAVRSYPRPALNYVEVGMYVGVVVFGLVVGCLTGFVGAGGAIIAVPALVYVVGVPLETAISTSLVIGGLVPIAALIPRLRKKLVDWRVTIAVAAAGVPAAFGGTAVGALLPQRVLLGAFAVLMVAAGIQMLRPRPDVAESRPRRRWWVLRALIVGAGVGFLTGLLGVGGGFITVPALVLALDLPITLAIGTSLAITVVNATAGILAHLGATQPDWAIAIAFGIPAAVASIVTARFSTRVSGKVLQRSFEVLVLVIAAITIVQVIIGN